MSTFCGLRCLQNICIGLHFQAPPHTQYCHMQSCIQSCNKFYVWMNHIFWECHFHVCDVTAVYTFQHTMHTNTGTDTHHLTQAKNHQLQPIHMAALKPTHKPIVRPTHTNNTQTSAQISTHISVHSTAHRSGHISDMSAQIHRPVHK